MPALTTPARAFPSAVIAAPTHGHGLAPAIGDQRALKDQKSWRRFSAAAPDRHTLVEIRRLHDDKTILRRRSDLPATFAWKTSLWRPA